MNSYSFGLDFGTNSARTVIVDTATGEEITKIKIVTTLKINRFPVIEKPDGIVFFLLFF